MIDPMWLILIEKTTENMGIFFPAKTSKTKGRVIAPNSKKIRISKD